MNTYTVKYSHTSARDHFGTLEQAKEAVRSIFSDAIIGHSGDIDDGGERTLCWADQDSLDRCAGDGSRACAVITANHEMP